MEEIIYLNGSLVPHSEALVSVDNHGFLYGYGLFETMRAYNGKIFRLERHLKRLNDSAEVISLGSRLTGIDLAVACRDTLKANNLDDARIRLTVTGGESASFPWSDSGVSPTVVITARPYTPFPVGKYEEGYKVFLATVRRSRESSLSRVKSTSYLLSVLARMEATANGLDEAILLNDDGYIAEGGGSNTFFVKSSRLMTPSLESGILPGITREVVMELAGELSIAVTEGTVGMAIIRQCDEAFVTNSMIEIMPLTEARDSSGNVVTVGGGKPGPVTRQLITAYKERVVKETASS